MRVHFIAIGGAVMHNLAIALHHKGYRVTGSDDEIFEPSKTRLEKYGLLPESEGWYPEKIESEIDFVVLGMHAMEDNPELQRARQLGLKVKSFPEFLYQQTRNKRRIVIGGSHGKTTITSMIMHVLKTSGMKFDYMVGSLIDGFETMVGLSDDAEIAVFEGDEYLTSPLDRRPKFHLYNPDIAVISGIAWDHINVFPDYGEYVEQFRIFTDKITPGGYLIYNGGDCEVSAIAAGCRDDIKKIEYGPNPGEAREDGFYALAGEQIYPLKIFGSHNMENISAAREVCLLAGLSEHDFFNAISDFGGSAKRLQLLAEKGDSMTYLDFAHAPSKVKATVNAVAERFPDHRKVCCFELHTFSSLSPGFLEQYRDSLSAADIAYVYFNPHALELKRLAPLDMNLVKDSFGRGLTAVFDNSEKLFNELERYKSGSTVYLFMSSGDFNGTDFRQVSERLLA